MGHIPGSCSFLHPFIQHIPIEYLLCAKPWVKIWLNQMVQEHSRRVCIEWLASLLLLVIILAALVSSLPGWASVVLEWRLQEFLGYFFESVTCPDPGIGSTAVTAKVASQEGRQETERVRRKGKREPHVI